MDKRINLRVLRAERDMKQYRLSELSGVAQSTISKFERGGENIKLSTLIKICKALDVSLSELVDYTPM